MAEHQSQFTHPEASHSPLSCQDSIIPVGELESENGYTVFCAENQGLFVIAASDNPTDTNTYVEGEAVFQGRATTMADAGVPLTECIITSVLRETILSVGNRYRTITPESLKTALEIAESGQTIKSRYIWSDSYLTFHLSKDVWFLDWDGMQFSAHRGLWRKKQSMWREQYYDKGLGWLCGPENPTLMQLIEKVLSRYRNL